MLLIWNLVIIHVWHLLIHSIMEGEKSFQRFSPEARIREPGMDKAASLLPPISLFHGTADVSIPSDARYLLRMILNMSNQTLY